LTAVGGAVRGGAGFCSSCQLAPRASLWMSSHPTFGLSRTSCVSCVRTALDMMAKTAAFSSLSSTLTLELPSDLTLPSEASRRSILAMQTTIASISLGLWYLLSFTDMSSPISLMPLTVRGEGVRGDPNLAT
jgi:hypothetical protein